MLPAPAETGPEKGRSRAPIHQYLAAGGGLDEGGVTLADIQKGDVQAAVRPAEGEAQGQRGDQEAAGDDGAAGQVLVQVGEHGGAAVGALARKPGETQNKNDDGQHAAGRQMDGDGWRRRRARP